MKLDDLLTDSPAGLDEAANKQAAHSLQAIRERDEDLAAAEELKAGILAQLRAGTEPQFILFQAVKAIGLLSNDQAWKKEAAEILAGMYEDIAQQSFLIDSATVAAERLAARQAEYISKLRRQLFRQLRTCQELTEEINDALDTIAKSEKEQTTKTE